ncbi:MAG: GTP pyrophosphokinase family protein [Clostridiales bacterium]|nr:GTP pyrophosphokinase family protein [Clostridiales bacterium]
MVHEKNSFIQGLLENISLDMSLAAEEDRREQAARLYSVYNAAIKDVGTRLEIISDEFAAMRDHNPVHHIEKRLKTPKSILEKMEKKKIAVSIENMTKYITDIAGLRVVCHYVEDIYELAELLLSQNDIVLLRRSDYIEKPKESGYRSLHLIIQVPIAIASVTEYIPAEVQIRTQAMDIWACFEHEIKYKSSNVISEEVARKLKSSATILSNVDFDMDSLIRYFRMRK